MTLFNDMLNDPEESFLVEESGFGDEGTNACDVCGSPTCDKNLERVGEMLTCESCAEDLHYGSYEDQVRGELH